jgi:hypothetical protein
VSISRWSLRDRSYSLAEFNVAKSKYVVALGCYFSGVGEVSVVEAALSICIWGVIGTSKIGESPQASQLMFDPLVWVNVTKRESCFSKYCWKICQLSFSFCSDSNFSWSSWCAFSSSRIWLPCSLIMLYGSGCSITYSTTISSGGIGTYCFGDRVGSLLCKSKTEWNILLEEEYLFLLRLW